MCPGRHQYPFRVFGTGVAAVLVLAALCNTGQGEPSCDNSGFGYLMAPSLSPGHILKPSSIFVLPRLEAKGTERVDFDFHWGNVWNRKPNEYMVDGEWIRSTLRYSYAVKDDLSVGLAVPMVGRTGGWADSSVESFHSALGLGTADRDKFPRNQSRVVVTDDGTDYTVVEGESWGIGDVSAFFSSRLTEGTRVWPAVTVQGEVSLPTGDEDELRGLGVPAVALSSVASKRVAESPFITFLGLGIQYCDADDISIIRIRDEQFSLLAGVEYQHSQSLGVVVQYLLSSAVAKQYYAFAKPSHEVSVGFKWHLGPGNSLELSVVENVAVFQNSADIGIHLAYGWRF